MRRGIHEPTRAICPSITRSISGGLSGLAGNLPSADPNRDVCEKRAAKASGVFGIPGSNSKDPVDRWDQKTTKQPLA